MVKSKLPTRAKLVLVGDDGSGKTCLCTVYAHKKFPVGYTPSVFEGYIAETMVQNGSMVELAFWDTIGQEDYDRIRPLSYINAHVILLIFAIDAPDAFANIGEKWCGELNKYCKRVPKILVGTKTDLRNDRKTVDELGKISQKPVSYEEGVEIAKWIEAVKYMECSAKLGDGVEEIFDLAAEIAYNYVHNQHRKRIKLKCCICL